MKQINLALLSLISAVVLSAQQTQTPLYIMYNSACMDQLEYRYVYAGNGMTAFSIHPTANEQYILTAGTGGINSPTLPKNTVNCREYALNEQFLNDVNSVSRQVYLVHQTAKGYLLIPVISASQVLRSGTYYLFRAPNYSFAIDTSNLVYESNIATGTSSWYIYFNGLKIRGCYYEYSFKREPTKLGQERSELDFVPGIGITSERTGLTAADAEANHMRLVRVNGMALEDYIAAQCQTTNAAIKPGSQPLSQYTPQVNYGAMPVREGDKEMSSIPGGATTTPAAAPLPPRLANCPEQPGEGYHIVQPGESLNAIARAYTVPVKSLISWNKIKDPDKISVCQKIWLRKPPVQSAALAYKGGENNPATYSYTTPTIRQDAYWQTGAAATQQPATYNYATPAQYNYVPAPAAPATTAQPYIPPAQTLVHTVQKGETLYGIGARYGLTEADMRRFNNFPPTGEVVVKPGMQLFVADCCPTNNTSSTYPPATAPATNYPNLAAQPQYNTPTQPQQYNTTSPQYTPPPAQYNTTQPQYNYNTLPDLYSTPTNTQPVPNTYNYTPPTQTAGQDATSAQPQPAATKQPAYFQEYIVREGDTINSIAIKFKASAQEIALVNNKDPNETLIAGQRLLIPRN